MHHSPNYTEYLQNLNHASPLDEDPFNSDRLDLQSLEMFTNANFTHVPEENFNFEMNTEGDVKYQDLLAGEPTHQPFGTSTVGNSPSDNHFFSSYNTPIQPAPAHGFPTLESQSPVAHTGAARRAGDSIQTQGSFAEEKSRMAAEEDKRRRNTAASARFRVKKKQREQALEKNVKDVADKNVVLEAKISQLEMENKWLKDLITEKNAVPSREELESKYLEFKRESEEREADHHTTGVGTD